jgi:hypothetical protein
MQSAVIFFHQEQKVSIIREMFGILMEAPIKHICLENPVGMINTCYRQPDQIIHPYYFRGSEKKQTCLWLKNLPPLFHSKHDTLFEKRTHGELGEDFIMNSSHRQTKWYNNNKNERSTLFPSIAEAMADQWAKHLKIKI